MKSLFFAFMLIGTLSCYAQTIPAAVQEAFQNKFPGISVRKWDKEKDSYEANFSDNNKTMSATFTAGGVWQETEADINIHDLPAAVTGYLKKHYKDASIKEAALITTKDGQFYEAEVKKQDLIFDINGNFVRLDKEAD